MSYKVKVIPKNVKDLFSYDPETGVLCWKVSPRGGPKHVGDEAGCLERSGYRVVKIDRSVYKVHRVIYYMIHGCDADVVDHIDGNRSNNRPGNLRNGTLQINNRNTYMHRNGKRVGVGWHKQAKRWRAYKYEGRKQIFIGYFDSEALAIEALSGHEWSKA